MPTITIPRELAKIGELVLIPRKEYDELLHFRMNNVREVGITLAQKRALVRARKNLSTGKFLTSHELRQKLAR